MQESKEIPILHTFTGLSNSVVNEAFKDFKGLMTLRKHLTWLPQGLETNYGLFTP